MISLNIGRKEIYTDKPAFVMGILNVTPDSFYEKSRGGIEKAFQLISQGADIIDIGGESTRPGFTQVDCKDEIERIIPVINEIRKESDIPISVDTRKSEVLRAAINAGADILNDVSALEDDENMVDLVSETGCGLILMHRFNHQEETRNTNLNITEIVKDYLIQRANFAISKGVKKEKIILDPGIGFGKTNEENIILIKQSDLLCKCEYPILMALSRKRCIGEMTGQPVENRMAGTLAADLLAVEKGCKLIRVHDVKEAVDSLNVMKYIQ